MTSACPSCRQPLIPFACGGIELVRCWGGHGVWIDNTLSGRLARGEFPPEVVGELSRLEAHSPQRNEAHPAGACPKCSGPLTTHFVEVGQVAVDVCQRHGTWLDAGELARIARGEVAPPPRAPAPSGLPSDAESRENTRRLEALVSAPTEGTYAKGLRVMPGAIALAIADGINEAAESAANADTRYTYYDDNGKRREGDLLLGAVFGFIAMLLSSDD